MQEYTADPAWCAIVYTYTISAITDDSVVAFNDDPAIREFSFLYDSNLDLCGATSTAYTITVTGTSGNIVSAVNSASFTLTLKNPCIDPNFVTIS